MRRGRLRRLLILAVATAAAGVPAASLSAQNSFWLQPASNPVTVGEPFQLSLRMDFSDSTVGGGVRLSYDASRMSLDAIAVALGDSDFRCPGSSAIACPSDPNYLSFGQLTGLTGSAAVATITFTPVASGILQISLAPGTAFGQGGGGELTVDLGSVAVDSGGVVVPLLSWWSLLLLSASLMLCARLVTRRLRAGMPAASWIVLTLIVFTAFRVAAQASGDADLDGIDDSLDNCTNAPNPDQRDSNDDGYGNLCDPDLDNDEDVDNDDLNLMKTAFFGADADADLDGSGSVDFLDLGLMSDLYGSGPGPKCVACTPASGSFCGPLSSPISIPDGDSLGVTDVLAVTQAALISDLNVSVRISHGWVGDVSVALEHGETGTVVDLVDRPGVPASSFGCSASDIDAHFDDEAGLPAEEECATPGPALGGTLLPNAALDAFDGENVLGTWSLTLKDSSLGVSGALEEWCLRLNDPAPPPVQPEVGLTGYRPQSEAYGAPLQRRSIPDAEEESPGAGVRINGDDDDGSLTPDRDEVSVIGENDLIEVAWVVNQAPAPTGFEYVLRRSNSSIRVWSSATKGTALLGANDESVLSPSATSGSVWVENSLGGTASLTLEARAISDASVVSSDRIQFFPFTSLVIGLHGEFQFPTDPVFGPNEGISVLAIALHEQAYDSHMYVENLVAADGSGAVYDEIVSAVQNRGITSVALYGFSHGGGSVYDLSERLAANQASIGSFELLLSAYIDGIENDSDVDLDAEVRLPLGTAYHVNYYQSFGFVPPWGGSVAGADVNVNVSATFWGFLLVHITITNSGVVQNAIYEPLLLRVPR
jgi:hypothetical protein